MRIFVSGPYTQGDPVVNTRNAILCGEEILKLGHSPYIPHLTHLWHFLCPGPLEQWYKHDLEWLVLCDGVIRLPGHSLGADKECLVATQVDIPIFYGIIEFKEYLQKRGIRPHGRAT